MNPLSDVLSPPIRKVAYAVLFVAAIIFAAFQAADGDWWIFVGSLITAFLGLLANNNTYAPRQVNRERGTRGEV